MSYLNPMRLHTKVRRPGFEVSYEDDPKTNTGASPHVKVVDILIVNLNILYKTILWVTITNEKRMVDRLR